MMKPIIVANWKSHKNAAESKLWLDELQQKIQGIPEAVLAAITVIVAPPAVNITALSNHSLVISQPFFSVALQDISPFPAGSYTGAISAFNVGDLGVQYAIVGHSERRRYFHETNEDVAKKVRECLDNEITPIVCVDAEYVVSQAAAIDAQHRSHCIVAYEPLAAIGSGENSSAESIAPLITSIKSEFGSVPVLYGGSVDEQNMIEYRGIVDGFLIGTASLEVAHFAAILNQAHLFISHT